jgi:hypothetical protein
MHAARQKEARSAPARRKITPGPARQARHAYRRKIYVKEEAREDLR